MCALLQPPTVFFGERWTPQKKSLSVYLTPVDLCSCLIRDALMLLCPHLPHTPGGFTGAHPPKQMQRICIPSSEFSCTKSQPIDAQTTHSYICLAHDMIKVCLENAYICLC